jgi:ribosomal-protein-alanine N-acetyltransferase
LIDSQKRKTEICVRAIRPDDSGGVVAVTGESPEAAQWTPEMFRNEIPGERGWVAEERGEIVGFLVARMLGEEAEILNLAVTAKARRKGIATKLLVRASDEMTRAGAQSCFLEVRESNVVAKAFYTKMGFGAIGTRPRYYQQPEEGALCMEKKLTALTGQDYVPT